MRIDKIVTTSRFLVEQELKVDPIDWRVMNMEHQLVSKAFRVQRIK